MGARRTVHIFEMGVEHVGRVDAHHLAHVDVAVELVVEFFDVESRRRDAPAVGLAGPGVGRLGEGGVDGCQREIALPVGGTAVARVDAHTIHPGDEFFV